jgi:Uma2 family endonuclease
MIAGGNPGSGTMTIAQRGQQTLTLDEFLAQPEEKPALEYASGVITQKMSPDRDHGGLEYILCRWINDVAQPRKLAFAFPEFRAIFHDEDVSRVPDVSVYTWARIPRDRSARGGIYAIVPPDIAIEIASPGQGRRALLDRCRWFVAHGSQAAILVDPRRQDLTEIRPNGVERRLHGTDVLDLGDIIPGLAIPVGELFAALSFD